MKSKNRTRNAVAAALAIVVFGVGAMAIYTLFLPGDADPDQQPSPHAIDQSN